MGARDELVNAARSLADEGIRLFSPSELIAKVRTRGSTYKDSTLRTHIVSVMCANSPDHHSVRYGDFERVSHGLYRLADSSFPSNSGETVAEVSPGRESADSTAPPTTGWYWEGDVQASIVAHLAREGWRIKRVADTASSEHGVDIEAERADERLLVEVKGYPGTTYARGTRKGEAKSGSQATQARNYFGNALLSGMIMRAKAPGARVVLAFPKVPTFGNLAIRVAGPLTAAGIEVWLVSEDGSVDSLE